MVKKILGAFAVLVLALVVVVSMQPATYHVERSVVVPAEPAVAYDVISDFRRFNEWSPWAELDPDMKTTFSGAETGAGAVYEWKGNDQVGSGRMEITSAEAPERVDMHLTFIEPFPSQSETYYTIEPADGGAKVTWVMDGENDFMAKAFGLFMDMEAMIGEDFDKGLASLKMVTKAEADRIAEEEATVLAEAEAQAKAEEAADADADADEAAEGEAMEEPVEQ